MNDESPVSAETNSSKVTPRSNADAAAPGPETAARVGALTETARITTPIARLHTPAARLVPGRPTAGISQNVEARTPMTAPMLLQKYSIATVRPGAWGSRRSTPATIRGNVAPRSTDCGRSSSEPSTKPAAHGPSELHARGI